MHFKHSNNFKLRLWVVFSHIWELSVFSQVNCGATNVFLNDNHFSKFFQMTTIFPNSLNFSSYKLIHIFTWPEWNRIEIALTRWQKLFELVCNRMFALQPVVPNLPEKKKNNKKNTFFCLLLVYSYSKNSVATNCDFFLTNLKYILFYKKIWFDFTKKKVKMNILFKRHRNRFHQWRKNEHFTPIY